MATVRADISMKNKYWIGKHRYYELKHFCLQYPEWKRAYRDANKSRINESGVIRIQANRAPGDPTGNTAVDRMFYQDLMGIIERTAKNTDEDLQDYILKAVTEGLSYIQLKSGFNIPCGRDMYYDRYRRFFWLLNKERG